MGDGSFGDYALHLILPSLVLALVNVAVWSRYMRAATLEVLSQDFVRTAKAKGLPPTRVLMKHIVGNALVPMITLAGMQLPTLLSGAPVTETTAQVRFTKTWVSDGEGISDREGKFTATVTFRFEPTKQTALDLVWQNPTGFLVTDYRLTSEALTPSEG